MTPEPGAPAAAGHIPLSVPEIRGNEWRYVKECLDTGWVSSAGPFVDRFEREIAAIVGMPHAVATVSGTAAIHVALLLAGIEPDDEVLVSTLSFVAPANAVRYLGGWPVFVDADPEFWQLDVALVREFLERRCERRDGRLVNRRSGRRVRALLPVHLLGHPCDMDPLLTLAEEHGLAVVEDATESLGARYRERPVGALGPISCFSFNGNKVITTGGGGMIVTRDAFLAERGRYLVTQAKDDPIEYVHEAVGFNYRLSNVHAAIGCAQLEQLSGFVEHKRAIARRYREGLNDVRGLAFMREAPWAESTFWLSTILVDEIAFGTDSRGLMRVLGARGIQARPLWTPLHANPIYRSCEVLGGAVAVRVQQQGLSLPSSAGATASSVDRVIEAIRDVAASGR